mgnify:CR=1 FL=1
MKKKIFAIFFMLMLIAICQSEAATTYNLVITDINYGTLPDLDKIAGFESNISGTAGTDWVINTVSSRYAIAPWNFDQGISTDPTFFGGADDSVAQNVWLENGIVLTITSPNDTPLTLSNFVAFDYRTAGDFSGNVTANLNAVPIPGSILLLGSGLVGLIGIARRKRS